MAEGNGENLQALPLLEQDAGNQIVPVEQQYKHHNVVCLIKNNKDRVSGTGFIGFYPQTNSRYLLTCHHVLPGGGGNKETIRKADIIFEFKTDKINSVSFKGDQLFDMDHFESYTSPVKITKDEYGMDYTMIKVRDDMLTHYEPFELTDEYGVAKGYHVTIMQHADGQKLSTSNHRCSNKVGFLVYYGAHTMLGSSGAPVVRAINEKYRVVAIHCGEKSLNYGTLLSEIIYHVENNGEIKPGSKTTLRMVDDFKNQDSSLEGLDFSKLKVDVAFTRVHLKLLELLTKANVTVDQVYHACFTNANTELGVGYPKSLEKELTMAKTVSEFCKILMKHPTHWSWLNIQVMEKIASLNDLAIKLVDSYKSFMYGKKLTELLSESPSDQYKIEESFYTPIKEKWKKTLNDITLKDIEDHKLCVGQILGFNKSVLVLIKITKGCVENHWLIPKTLAHRAHIYLQKNQHKLPDFGIISINFVFDNTSSQITLQAPIQTSSLQSQDHVDRQQIRDQEKASTDKTELIIALIQTSSLQSQDHVDRQQIRDQEKASTDKTDGNGKYQYWWRKKLDECLYELSESLYTSVDGILMQMRPNLATSEYLDIDIITNPMRKVEKLIRAVRSRDLTIFNEFCDILKKSGHESLAEKLRASIQTSSLQSQDHVDRQQIRDQAKASTDKTAAQILEDEYKKWMKIIDFSVDKGFPRDEIKVLIEVVNQCEFHAAMLEMMDGKVTEHRINQCDSCFVGKWGDVPVVIVQTAMGQKYNASYDTTKEVLKAMPHIKYVFGVGVCVGVKGRVELGEIVVSSRIIGYDTTKTMPDSEDNHDYVGTCENQEFYQFIKKSKWDDAKVRFGPVLSGSKIVADSKTQADLRTKFCPTALAFEIEGCGIAAACDHNHDNTVHCLIIKGVSDHADKHQNDDWQPDAAKYAAAYLKYMLNEFFGRNM